MARNHDNSNPSSGTPAGGSPSSGPQAYGSPSADDEGAAQQAAERELAELKKRIALLDADEARISYEKSKLADQGIEVARGLEDQSRQRAEFAAAEQKLRATETALARRHAQIQAELTRRSAEADAAIAALRAMEQSLAQRQAELDVSHTQRRDELETSHATRREELEKKAAQAADELEQASAQRQAELARQQSAIDDARQTLQRQQDAFEADLRNRLATLERSERDMAALRESTVAHHEEAESKAERTQRELQAVQDELKLLGQQQELLRREQELARQQRADAERVTHEMETQRDRLRSAEREVLGGWDEIRRGQAAVAKSREQLERERKELAVAPPAPVIRVVQRQLGQGTYRKWAAGLAITTAAVLLVTELTIVLAVRPVYQSVRNLQWTAVDGSPEPAATAAIKEVRQFLQETNQPIVQQTGTMLAGPDWRVELLPAAETSADTAVLSAFARADTARESLARSNGLIDAYHAWREAKLDLIRGADPRLPLEEIYRSFQTRQADESIERQAEQAARQRIVARAGLDAAATPTSTDVLPAVEALLKRLDAELASDQDELAKLAAARFAWQVESDQIRAAEATRVPADEAALAASLDQDRKILDKTRRLMAERRAKAQADVDVAQTEWDKASAALVEAVTQHETRTTDPSVVDAARKFEKAQAALTNALASADPQQNPLLKTWVEQIADLTDRVAANEKSLASAVAGRLRVNKLGELKAKLSQSDDKFQQLTSRVERQRAQRLDLTGDLEAYRQRVQRADAAQQRLGEVQAQLARASGIALGRVTLRIDAAAQLAPALSHNPRPAWMLAGGLIVLLLAAGAGWIILLVLTRPSVERELEPSAPAGAAQPTGTS